MLSLLDNFIDNEDKIGRKDFIEKIASCVDHLVKDENICIAIDGEWGSGKTFVMEKLYEKFNSNDSYLVVRYDAWECSFYDEPLFAIFSSILDCAKEKLSHLPGGKKGLKAVGKEIGKDALEELSKKSGKLGNLATFIKSFLKYIGIYKNGAIIDTSDEKSKEYKSYKSYLKEVQNSLNEFTTHSDYQGKKNKLIVLVDELDRCLPDMQLKILERLHHLFDVKNCAVICAINAESVAKNVVTTYGVDGYEYLRKFFDITYQLNKSTDLYLRSLLDEFNQTLSKTNNNSDNCIEATDIAYDCLCYGDKNVLKSSDNREILRYFLALNNICNDFGWEKLKPRYIFFIVIGLYIRKFVTSEFLSESDIISHEDEQGINNYIPGFREEGMPYFDFLLEYVGIDRESSDMHNFERQKFRQIPKLSWNFNEMIYYSLGKEFDYNELCGLYNHSPVIVEDCQELRRLIMLYGGEQKNAQDERQQN